MINLAVETVMNVSKGLFTCGCNGEQRRINKSTVNICVNGRPRHTSVELPGVRHLDKIDYVCWLPFER